MKFNNIVLFGGEVKNENMPVGFYSSLAILPLRGKPVIYRQLEFLQNTYGMDSFIVVVCKNNKILFDYVRNIISKRFDIKLVPISKKKSILSSLKYGLMSADKNIPTRVILGDTLICKSIDNETNVIYSSKNFKISKNWCLVDENGKFYDKKDVSVSDKTALVGYYSFFDTQYLLNCCLNARFHLKKEISSVLTLYTKKYDLRIKHIDDWYDLGHIFGLYKAKNILLNSRCFNTVIADTENGLLIKKSKKIEKLEDEASWYKNLPEELKIHVPRLISFNKNDKEAELRQELYGYPSLQELYLSGEVNEEDWCNIIEKLFSLHSKFTAYKVPADNSVLRLLYVQKTEDRIKQLIKQNEIWKNLFNKNNECINKKEYDGIAKLMPKIIKSAESLCNIDCQTIIHGDYCFSNILFDSNNYTFKLIDPRGRIATRTIYGDPRYDIAKLKHSVSGLYDFIVQGMYSLNEDESGFSYKIFSKEYLHLESYLKEQIVLNGYNPDEILFIEGLLFLSMIPLHSDSLSRQKMFYIKAIEIFNKYFKGV